MVMKQHTRILNMPVLLATVLVLCLLAFSPAVAKKKSHSHGSHGKKKGPTATQKKEIQVMKKILDKHQKALELAQLGYEKTTDTDVKTFCQNYASKLEGESDDLQAWLKNWYQINSYSPKMGSADEFDDLLALEGVEFTTELLHELVGMHNSNIAQEKQANKRGYTPDLRNWANDKIAIERQEVAQLKAWLQVYDPEDD